MPSTNVNVGLLEGRSSSRILKPPGGGHSDIFGRDTPAAEARQRNKNAAQHSAIQDCLYNSDTSDSVNGKEANGAAVAVATVSGSNGDNPNGQEQQVVDTAAVVQEVKVVAPTVSAPPKIRVPPGGFSSGFW